jgi:hypothetical protein
MPLIHRTDVLCMYTIYHSPADYPGKYVVRMHTVPGGVTDALAITKTLEDARAQVPPQASVRWPRQEDDLPSIVEVWF